MKKIASALLFLSFIGLMPVMAQEVTVTAEVNTNKLVRGEPGRYTITFENTNAIPDINLNAIDGLEISNIPQTSRINSIINGVSTNQIQLTWYFRTLEVGTYTFPEKRFIIKGKRHAIDPITIEVVDTSIEANSKYYLRLIPDRTSVYIGEEINAELKLFIRSNVQLNPTGLDREGEAFLHELIDGRSTQVETVIDGVRYLVLTWKLNLSPIKTGLHELAFNMEANLIKGQRRDPFSTFGFSRSQSESITIFGQAIDIEVKPVPEEGRPESFNGAVGTIQVNASISSQDLQVGEPFTFTLELKGNGNIDRVNEPELLLDENWRVYPPKKSVNEASTDGIHSVEFEYIIIPQSQEPKFFPEVSYTVFNPLSEEFETTTIEPQAITIKASEETYSSTSLPLSFLTDQTNAAQSAQPSRLLANIPSWGSSVESFLPTWKSRLFWIIQFIIVIIFLVGFLYLNHQSRLSTDKSYAGKFSKSKRLKKAIDNALKAAKANDVEAFYHQATLAIKIRIGLLEYSGSKAETLLLEDLKLILSEHEQDSSNSTESISSFFSQADAIHFAGKSLDSNALQKAETEFLEILKQLPNK